ncbi:MAG: ubiquinone/menaquinone biosynthesis methyltransferase [Fidelibacterota bacterium]|nr:MAG: ubiquinone/menaquinone biosynthesis methyltransferase [Candidatus Neomarinimicrobiota bacterium]
MTRFIHYGGNKRRFVRRMFGEITRRYDLTNRVLTLGMDTRWRRRLAAILDLHPGDRVLDLACGTGDVALQVGRSQPHCRVVGADPVPAMLARAAERFPPIAPVCCEGEALPFRENTFQAVTIAFGARNFSCLERGLQQVYQVLAPGGRLGILEFALPDRGFCRGFYRWYLTWVLPRLGALFNRGYAYQYLVESIRHFPAPAVFLDLLASVGFTEMNTRRFLGGAVWLYYGRK